ncbi:MAG: phytoene desaturase family protein [Planctomycetes bacterium]|nr:phytoene desaturase family protein [Planctomycetota bacterium]
MTDRVGVIGGGLGGLAAAVTLAGRGHEVVVFERAERLGGKASRLEVDGFAFDVGPTVLTLPSVLRRVFAEAGARLEERLDLVRLDPQWRSFFDDGATLDLVADEAAMRARLAAFAGPAVADGYGAFLARAERLDRIARAYFFWRSVGGLGDAIRAGLRPALLPDLLALGATKSVASLVRSYVPDARVAQMLDHFTQYVGSAPDQAPAVLCGIAHMQTDEGVHYPLGGTAAVARALDALAADLGVERRPGVGVRRVLLDAAGRARGVETDEGEAVPLAAVVSNADSGATARDLVGGRAARRFDRRGHEPACSGVVLYLGLDRGYDHLLHHNFVFSRDPHAEFEAIYRRGEPTEDPTCYVCAPARTEPGVAPPGGEALYVLVHAPWRRPHQDWTAMLPAYRRVILDKLRRTAGLEDLERRVVVERVMTPADIERRWSIPGGAIYGHASHGRLTGAFKPANRSEVPGLYLAGGSAHPGPGMPMALMSGWIAADCLDRDGVAPRRRRAAGAAR